MSQGVDDEDAWMAKRRRSLVRLKKKRQQRRAGMGINAKEDGTISTPQSTTSADAADSDDAARTLVNGQSPRNKRVSVVEEEEDEGFDESCDFVIPSVHH